MEETKKTKEYDWKKSLDEHLDKYLKNIYYSGSCSSYSDSDEKLNKLKNEARAQHKIYIERILKLSSEGWTVYIKDCIINVKKDGIRLSSNLTWISRQISLDITIRCDDGIFRKVNGWLNLLDKNWYEQLASIKYTKKDQIQRLTRANLPEPLKFITKNYIIENDVVILNVVLRNARVISLVAIKLDASISEQEIAVPGAEPWYKIIARTDINTDQTLISNGCGYYVIKSLNKEKITFRREHIPENIFHLTELDGQIINGAINRFNEKLRKGTT